MNVVKASLFSFLSATIKVFVGFFISKILAVYLGPNGFALVGQFRNFVQVVQKFSGGVTDNGVVKYVAEFKHQESERNKIVSTAFWITLLSSFIVSILVFYFRKDLSRLLFDDDTKTTLFAVLSVVLVLSPLNSMLISIINGYKKVKQYTYISFSNSIVGLLIILILVVFFGLKGALYSIVFYQTLIFFITLIIISRMDFFSLEMFLEKPDFQYIKNFSKFILMSLATIISTPLVHLYIRTYLAHNINLFSAGMWDAMNRISDGYMMIITIIFTTYLFPALSEKTNKSELISEILNTAKFILPLTILGGMLLYMLRDFIIHILFTSEFVSMRELFLYQIIGDIFRASAWMITALLRAKAMMKIFIFSELFFAATNVVLVKVFVPIYGLQGATLAFGLNFLLYFIFMVGVGIYYFTASIQNPIEAS